MIDGCSSSGWDYCWLFIIRMGLLLVVHRHLIRMGLLLVVHHQDGIIVGCSSSLQTFISSRKNQT